MRESILDIPLGDERHDEDPCTVQFDASLPFTVNHSSNALTR
ncbi:MAG: hypothetical protein ACI9U5_001180 [Colwellia sp.]|jgi:hypothetical protein